MKNETYRLAKALFESIVYKKADIETVRNDFRKALQELIKCVNEAEAAFKKTIDETAIVINLIKRFLRESEGNKMSKERFEKYFDFFKVENDRNIKKMKPLKRNLIKKIKAL